MPTVAEQLTELQAEQLRLFAAFCALGLDERDALRLAEVDASPSRARSMKEHGCPLNLVAEILA